MKRLLLVAAAALLWVAPAQTFSKQTGFRTMTDGVQIAYDLYEPDGAVPAAGWPGVVVLHGLGGSKDSMAPIADAFVSHGYAVLAYTDRGHGTSGGDAGLAGPDDTATERAMLAWFEGLPEVSDTQVGAWGISYGGGQTWNGLAAGIPYKAAAVVETWTDLFTALWPQDIAKSGIVLGFAKSIDARSPLIAASENDAIHSTNMPAVEQLADTRSAYAQLPKITTPVYMFQGRVDYAFDVTQAAERVQPRRRAEAPLHRAVRPRAVHVPRPGCRLCPLTGARLVRPLPEGRTERDRQVEAGHDRCGNGLEARLIRGTAEDEGDHGRLPRNDAATDGSGLPAGARDIRGLAAQGADPEGDEVPASRRHGQRRQSCHHARRHRPEGGVADDQARELRAVPAEGDPPPGRVRAVVLQRRHRLLRVRRRDLDLARLRGHLAADADQARHEMKRALVVVALACCVAPMAFAGGAPGVTSTSITIGGTVPITGPAALFGSVGRGADAYFKYVNAHGGVNGRKIKYLYLDDAYDPSKTVQLTRQLVEQDHVFAIFNSVGTDNNLAITDYLNAAQVPQLFGGTGTSQIGDDFKSHPWTMGYLPSFRSEGVIYGRAIAAHLRREDRRALGGLGLRQGHGDRPQEGTRRESRLDRLLADV